MAGFRKRVYAKAFKKSNGFRKRRRFNKRRGGKIQSTTSKSGYARAVGTFKGKKMSRRKYNNVLWNSTMMDPHYRSVYGVSNVISTNAAANVSNVAAIPALHPDGNLFWQAAGGAIPVNPGGAIPNFSDDIVIRGGVIGITLANDVADSAIIRIYG